MALFRTTPLIILAMLSSPAVHAQVVHYKISGDYHAQTVIAYQETGGQATVKDRVVLELDWDIQNQKVVGPVTIENFKSEMSDLRNVEISCPKPSPKGAYEHIDVESATDNGYGTLELKGLRLTCPRCGHKSKNQMPTNACQYFYDCTSCGALLKPEKGDCCVYCSYGDVKCPPVQLGNSCCPSSDPKADLGA